MPGTLNRYLNYMEARGIDRREFLKYCGAVAATAGIAQASGAFKVADALAANAERPSVVWLNFASDTGCTESLIKSTYPTAGELILDTISMDYHDTIMAGAGEAAEKSRTDALKKGGYLLIVEGGVPTKKGHGTIAGKNMYEILEEMAPKASAIIAVGSCATFGGVPSMKPNPSEIEGIQPYLNKKFGKGKYTVVNLDMCPVNPRNLTATIVNVLVLGKVPELDSFGRPLIFHGRKIHDHCERRAHFDAGRFVEVLGDENEARSYCLFKVGCKGPMTFSNCSTAHFDDRVSWCIRAGGPCIGCAEHDWPDKFAGFSQRLPNIDIPGFGGGVEVTADRLGAGLAVATGIGIAAHAVASAANKRGKDPASSSESASRNGGE